MVSCALAERAKRRTTNAIRFMARNDIRERAGTAGSVGWQSLGEDAPHPAFGHPLPASGARGNTYEHESCCPSPRLRGEGARSADEGPETNRLNFDGAHHDRAVPPTAASVPRCPAHRTRS